MCFISRFKTEPSGAAGQESPNFLRPLDSSDNIRPLPHLCQTGALNICLALQPIRVNMNQMIYSIFLAICFVFFHNCKGRTGDDPLDSQGSGESLDEGGFAGPKITGQG